jgi:thiol-disulfide isomerase/thioredoxin/tetratricopeptide (TPR) repeat protein
MNKVTKLLFGLTVLCASAFAQKETKPTFGIGAEVSDYPKVEWIQGDPVTKFDKDKIYIVECWATWCGPCKAAIPHVNELYKKFGDKVIIIGQDIWETNKSTVANFVKKQGDGMSYRIAFGGGMTSDFSMKFMKAAGFTSIPRTFVIQDNKVVWTPDPSQLTEAAIQSLIDHKFSLEAAKKMDPAKKYEPVAALMAKGNNDQAMVAVDSILQKYPFENTGVMIKWSLFNKMGKQKESLAYLKNAFEQSPTAAVKYLYFKTLQDNKQWDVLANTANAYLKENPGDDDDAAEAMIALYAAYNGKHDFKSAAEALIRFTNFSKNDETLLRLAFINRIVKPEEANAAVMAAAIKAGEKSLSIAPGNVVLLGEIVKNKWNSNDQAGAKASVKKELAISKKDPLQKRRTEIFNEVLTSLDKGVLPTDAQFKTWYSDSKN